VKSMPTSARVYIATVMSAGALSLVGMLSRFDLDPVNIAMTTVVAALAAIAQVLKVEGPTKKSSYNLSLVAYGFAFVLLGPSGAAIVILASCLVEWAWYRYPWYIQAFNIGALMLSVGAAASVVALVPESTGPAGLGSALAVLAAGGVLIFLNHLFVGMVIWLARGEDFRESGIFEGLPIAIDGSLLGLGAGAAFIWQVNPWASLLALPPLYLFYATLRIPSLERQAVTDSKTGLYNARFFNDALARELERADRYDRPLTVVMGDLDLLRNINNTYGHLAGDVVLKGVADVLTASVRDYDIVSRFGGEEFAILMGETSLSEALGHVEDIRRAIESAMFDVPTSADPIGVTMSFGLAERHVAGQAPQELIHNADLALYQAKIDGRNRVCIAAENWTPAEDAALQQVSRTAAPASAASSAEVPRRLNTTVPALARATFAEEAHVEPAPMPASRVPSATSSSPVHTIAPSQHAWLIDSMIAGLAVLALVFTAFGIRTFGVTPDVSGLLLFTCVTALAEWLSIDINVRDTSVSTSVAPFIAGSLLFGPVGVVCVSVAAATAAYIKHRSPLSRLVFNASSHIVAGVLALGVAEALQALWGTGTWSIAAATIAVALVVYASTTFLLAVMIALTTDAAVRTVWRDRFRWLAPYYVALGVIALAFVFGYQRTGALGALVILAPMLMVRFGQEQYVEHAKRIVGELRVSNVELARRSGEIDHLNTELLQVLSDVVDLRDPFVLGHAQRVADYAALIAVEMGFTEERTEMLRKAALLHDIGKLGIPEAILFKPGALTYEEYEIMKRHAELGADIIGHSASLSPVLPAVRHHHERWDGKGYPDGIAGHAVPLEARILGVADAVEAMASDRPYRKALTAQEILEEIARCAGSQFDQKVVHAFTEIIRREGEDVIVNSAIYVQAATAPGSEAEARLTDLRAELGTIMSEGYR